MPTLAPDPALWSTLSPREQEIFALLSLGNSNKRIAAALHLAVGTVQSHVNRLVRKVGANNRTAAVAAVYGFDIGGRVERDPRDIRRRVSVADLVFALEQTVAELERAAPGSLAAIGFGRFIIDKAISEMPQHVRGSVKAMGGVQ